MCPRSTVVFPQSGGRYVRPRYFYVVCNKQHRVFGSSREFAFEYFAHIAICLCHRLEVCRIGRGRVSCVVVVFVEIVPACVRQCIDIQRCTCHIFVIICKSDSRTLVESWELKSNQSRSIFFGSYDGVEGFLCLYLFQFSLLAVCLCQSFVCAVVGYCLVVVVGHSVFQSLYVFWSIAVVVAREIFAVVVARYCCEHNGYHQYIHYLIHIVSLFFIG